jgi:hypothetical protein
MPDRDEELTKVHIDLPDNPDTGGEAMWAKPLGADLYELRNSPFHAYHVNFLDVVRAIQASPSLKPSVREVVSRSGHRTIWVTFDEAVDEDRRIELLTELNEWRAFYEGRDRKYFAVDVEPDGDYEQVLYVIERWRLEGLLERYRTGPSDGEVRDA